MTTHYYIVSNASCNIVWVYFKYAKGPLDETNDVGSKHSSTACDYGRHQKAYIERTTICSIDIAPLYNSSQKVEPLKLQSLPAERTFSNV